MAREKGAYHLRGNEEHQWTVCWRVWKSQKYLWNQGKNIHYHWTAQEEFIVGASSYARVHRWGKTQAYFDSRIEGGSEHHEPWRSEESGCSQI